MKIIAEKMKTESKIATLYVTSENTHFSTYFTLIFEGQGRVFKGKRYRWKVVNANRKLESLLDRLIEKTGNKVKLLSNRYRELTSRAWRFLSGGYAYTLLVHTSLNNTSLFYIREMITSYGLTPVIVDHKHIINFYLHDPIRESYSLLSWWLHHRFEKDLGEHYDYIGFSPKHEYIAQTAIEILGKPDVILDAPGSIENKRITALLYKADRIPPRDPGLAFLITDVELLELLEESPRRWRYLAAKRK